MLHVQLSLNTLQNRGADQLYGKMWRKAIFCYYKEYLFFSRTCCSVLVEDYITLVWSGFFSRAASGNLFIISLYCPSDRNMLTLLVGTSFPVLAHSSVHRLHLLGCLCIYSVNIIHPCLDLCSSHTCHMWLLALSNGTDELLYQWLQIHCNLGSGRFFQRHFF